MCCQAIKLSLFHLSAVIAVLCLLGACAGSKLETNSPAGIWNYTVMGTSYGTVNGKMTIMEEGGIYAGQLESDKGVAALEDITVDGKKFTSTLEVEGNKVSLEGYFDNNTFQGRVIAGSNSYVITAKRSR